MAYGVKNENGVLDRRDQIEISFSDESKEPIEVVVYTLLASGTPQRLTNLAQLIDNETSDWVGTWSKAEQWGILDAGWSSELNEESGVYEDRDLIGLDSYEIQGEDRQKVVDIFTKWLTEHGVSVTVTTKSFTLEPNSDLDYSIFD